MPRNKPRPRFWLAGDTVDERDEESAIQQPQGSAYLQTLMAERSVPCDVYPAYEVGGGAYEVVDGSGRGTAPGASSRLPLLEKSSRALLPESPYTCFAATTAGDRHPWGFEYLGDDKSEYENEHDHEHRSSPPFPLSKRWRAFITFGICVVYACLVIAFFHCEHHSLGDHFSNQQQNQNGNHHNHHLLLRPPPAGAPDGVASSDDVGQWVDSQRQVAWRHVLDNIGPAAGAADGLVIASPSKGETDQNADYYFTWCRDSALTISALLPSFLPARYLHPWAHEWSSATTTATTAGEGEDGLLHNIRAHNHTHPLLEGVVRAYARAQAELQVQPNPSGDLWSGGLSEPKFNVDGTPFTRSWGRPQRDGPALRALALIPYAHWLLDRGYPADIAYVHDHMYNPTSLRRAGSVVKNDLEEVANMWAWNSFDLWEELEGRHLFTDAVSRRALQAGAGLAKRLGDTRAAAWYTAQAARLANDLDNYYNTTANYWHASAPSFGRSGLDSASLLASLHAGVHHTMSPHAADLAPTHPTVLSTLRAYVLSFAGLYRVNKGSPWTSGWLVGRYAEDVYDGVGFRGGNPWYICTFTVANVLYLAQTAFLESGLIELSPTSTPFWADVLGDGTAHTRGEWVRGSPEFRAATQRLGAVADAFLVRGLAAARPYGGHMGEQIGRNDGAHRGARDLTWSYASFLEVARARDAVKWAAARIGAGDEADEA